MLPLDAGPCQIRAWRPGDRAALVRHANNRKVWRMLRDQFPHPYTAADAAAWIAIAHAQNPLTAFAIVADGGAVGGIGIVLQTDIHRRTAELGYWVGEFSSNPASMRVLEKAGYVREAVLRQAVVKDGDVLDEIVYATTKDRW